MLYMPSTCAIHVNQIELNRYYQHALNYIIIYLRYQQFLPTIFANTVCDSASLYALITCLTRCGAELNTSTGATWWSLRAVWIISTEACEVPGRCLGVIHWVWGMSLISASEGGETFVFEYVFGSYRHPATFWMWTHSASSVGHTLKLEIAILKLKLLSRSTSDWRGTLSSSPSVTKWFSESARSVKGLIKQKNINVRNGCKTNI